MGIGLAAAGGVWHAAQKRVKERELLCIGHEFRQAIAQYYEKTPGPVKQYPRKLEELVHDDRLLKQAHHLRKLYRDPMTGRHEWGLVKRPDERIIGVFSVSEDQPLKIANFRGVDQVFADKVKYSEWKFVYTPGNGQRFVPGCPILDVIP